MLPSYLLMPRFESVLQKARALSVDCLSSYPLDFKRYGHVFKFDNVSLGTSSNLNFSDLALYRGIHECIPFRTGLSVA